MNDARKWLMPEKGKEETISSVGLCSLEDS